MEQGGRNSDHVHASDGLSTSLVTYIPVYLLETPYGSSVRQKKKNKKGCRAFQRRLLFPADPFHKECAGAPSEWVGAQF